MPFNHAVSNSQDSTLTSPAHLIRSIKSLTLSSLTFSIVQVGSCRGDTGPCPEMPFWSMATKSFPLMLRLGKKNWELWLHVLCALVRLLLQGSASEPLRLSESPWLLNSSSAKSTSESLFGGRKLKMLTWLSRLARKERVRTSKECVC